MNKLKTLLDMSLIEMFGDENGYIDFDVDEEHPVQDVSMSRKSCQLRTSISHEYPGYDPEVNFVFNVLATSQTQEQSFITSKLYFVSDEKRSFSREALKRGSVEHFHETLQIVTGRKIKLT